MTYRAGIGARLATKFGHGPSEPSVICDGCGAVRLVASKTSFAPTWFLNRKPPPGWRGLRMHDGTKRWDLCPDCWKEPAAAADATETRVKEVSQ